jgi:hypothetical protein
MDVCNLTAVVQCLEHHSRVVSVGEIVQLHLAS